MATSPAARGIRAYVAYALEAVWGQAPVGDLTKIGILSEGFSLERSTFSSQTLRPDRNVPGLTYGNKTAGGALNTEMFFGQWSDMIASTMFNDWKIMATSPILALTQETAPGAGDGVIQFTGDQTANLNIGGVVQVSGSTDMDGDYTVVSAVLNVGDTDVTVREDLPGVTIDGTGYSKSIINGVTQKSLYFERAMEDITAPVYMQYLGMVGNTMAIAMAPNSIVTANFEFMGQSEASGVGQHSATFGATPVDWSQVPMDSFSGVFKEAGIALGEVTKFDMSMTNNISENQVIGSDLTHSLNEEVFTLTGTMDALFTSDTLYNKFVNGTETSLLFEIAEAGSGVNTNNRYLISLPSVKYTGATAQVAGSGPIANSMPFQATYSAVEQATIIINELPAT